MELVESLHPIRQRGMRANLLAMQTTRRYIGAMSQQSLDPREIAERGTAIYERKYRADYEGRSRGRFAAIDIETECAYVADFPEEALNAARAAAPHGVFFLVRIGSPGAFKSSRLTHADNRGVYGSSMFARGIEMSR